MIKIDLPVGLNKANRPQDVKNILKLLNSRKEQFSYKLTLSSLKIPEFGEAEFDKKLAEAIKYFQNKVQKLTAPDGYVSAYGNTILFLGGVRSKGKIIIVDLDNQNLFAFEDGAKVFEFDCASGDGEHPTAKWPYVRPIFRKHEKYKSRTYNAQMDYAMFFTQDGKAIHQSNAVSLTSFMKYIGSDYFGSHGCVRLAEDDAKRLFKWTPMRTDVFIDLEKID